MNLCLYVKLLSMAHIIQDWEPVIIRKDSGKPKQQSQRAPESKKLDNLLSDDTEPPKTVGREVGKQLEQGRCAKKLSRVQLAKSLNLQEAVVRDHELGIAVLNKALVQRIARQLGIKIIF